MKQVSRLPMELWLVKVIPLLDFSDLLALRLVSREFNKIFSADEIWYGLVIHSWFISDDKMVVKRGYFQYFLERKRVDHEMLQYLKDEDVANAILMCDRHKSDLVLGLGRIPRTLQNLRVSYNAEKIMNYLQSVNAESFFEELVSGTEFNYEGILLALDPEVRKLCDKIKFRVAVRKEVIDKYRHTLVMNPNMGITKLVVEIINCFNWFVNLRFSNSARLKEFFRKITVDYKSEYFVYAVFNGENCYGMGYMAIICSICQDLGLEVTISHAHTLKIKDPAEQGGYSYILLDQPESIIVDGNYLTRSLSFHSSPTDSMTVLEFLELFLKETKENCPTLRYNIYSLMLKKHQLQNHQSLTQILESKSLSAKFPMDSIVFYGDKFYDKRNLIIQAMILEKRFGPSLKEYLNAAGLQVQINFVEASGKIAYHSRHHVYYVIIGSPKSNNIYDQSKYYLVVGTEGHLRIILIEQLEFIENLDDFEDFLVDASKFLSHNRLGAFFTSLDLDSKKFIPTAQLTQCVR